MEKVIINEVDLIIHMAAYMMAYDMDIKLIPAITKSANLLNDTRKDNDEPDLMAIKKSLQNEYGWRFDYDSNSKTRRKML